MVQEASVPPSVPLPAPGGRSPRHGSAPGPTPVGEVPPGESPVSAVALDQLLEVAVLSPAQAAHVAVELLTVASTIGPGRRAEALVSPPLVTSDGVVQVVAATHPAAGVAVDDLLTQLVGNARRLPAHPRPHQVALLRRLQEAAASSEEPAEQAGGLREALEDSVGPDAATRIAGELAALVVAFDQVAAVPRPTVASIGMPRVPPEGADTPGARRELGRRPPRGFGRKAAAAVVVCLLVAVGGYLVLGRPGSGTATGDQPPGRTHPPPRSSQTHHRAGTHPRTVVPALAHPSSGRVRGVALQRTGPCRSGASCTVRVTVQVTPAAFVQTVGWRVGVLRSCSRHFTWSPVTTVAAQPGWTRVYADSTVLVPAGHPADIVAVTSTPARAQSSPLHLVSAAPRC